jgi:hypothetical protein
MDKSKLIADRVTATTGEVEIPGVGTVKIRALSRWEMMQASKKAGDDPLIQERYILACAMLDPVMGEDDVAAWQKSSVPGEINEVAKAVNKLSGIGPDSAKEQYKSV